MRYVYVNGEKLEFTYDSHNRLIRAGETEYIYNAEDVRIKKTNSESTTEYIYDTNARLSRLLVKVTDGVVTKYVYGLGLIGQETNDSYSTYHFDYRGSTVAVTDSDGTVTDTFAYDTYGKITSSTGETDIIFRYNGRDGVVTDENGLYYMRARYYNPVIKRFINADIVSGDISNAVTLNRFAYANGNPVSFVDPFGLSPERGNNNALTEFLNAISFDRDQFITDFEELTALDLAGEILFNDDMLELFYNSMTSYISTAKRPKGMGKREWQRLVDAASKQLDDVYGPSSKLANGLKAVPYIAVGFDVLGGIFENINNGENFKEIATDIAIDAGFGAGSALLSSFVSGAVTGAIGGSVAPGVGTIIGIGVGALVGVGTYVFTEVVEFNGKSVVEWFDYWL